MANVGYATLSVIPSARGIGSKLTQQVAPEMDAAGRKSGGLFGGGLLSTAVKVAGPLAAAFAGVKIAGLVKDAAALDTALREVVTLTGETGAVAEKSLGVFREQVKGLSNEFGIAQETLTEGLYNALSAGVPRENALDFMQVASKASIAGVTDVNTAVDGLSSIINAFGLEVGEAQEVSDSLFTAVKGGKTTFQEMSDAIFNVAPAAAAAKVSFGEVNAAIATLTAGGTPTSVATTQIRAALTGLQKPSAELDKIFQALGHENAQLAVESEGLGFALDAVKKASNGNNGELQKLLGSTEAVSAANVLAGTGAEKFAQEMANQAEAAGATGDAFDVINQGAERQFEIFKTNMRNVGLSIGTALLPHLNKAVEFLNDKLFPAFGAVKDFLQPAVDTIKLFVGTLTGKGADVDLPWMNTVIDLGSRVRDAFDMVTGAAKQVFDILFRRDFTGGPLMEDSKVVEVLFRIRDGLVTVWDVAKQVFGVLFKGDFTGGPLAEDSKIVDVLFRIRDGFFAVADFVRANFVPALRAVGDFFTGSMLPVFVKVGGFLASTFSPTFRALSDFITRSAVPAFAGIVGAVRSALPALTSIAKVVGTVAAVLAVLAAKILGAVLPVLIQLAGILLKVVGKAIEVVVGALVFLVAAIEKVWPVVRAVGDVFKTVFENVVKIVRGAVDIVVGLFTGDFGKVKDGVASVLDGVLTLMRELPGKILKALGALGGLLFDVGKDMIQGLINGAGSLLKKLGEFFLDQVPGWIKGPFKKALGIDSPSKVFAGFGGDITDGLVRGMKAGQHDVERMVAGLVESPTVPAPHLAGLGPSAAASGSGFTWNGDLILPNADRDTALATPMALRQLAYSMGG